MQRSKQGNTCDSYKEFKGLPNSLGAEGLNLHRCSYKKVGYLQIPATAF